MKNVRSNRLTDKKANSFVIYFTILKLFSENLQSHRGLPFFRDANFWINTINGFVGEII